MELSSAERGARMLLFRIVYSGKLLWKQWLILGNHKRLTVSWQAEWLSAFQEWIYLIELVSCCNRSCDIRFSKYKFIVYITSEGIGDSTRLVLVLCLLNNSSSVTFVTAVNKNGPRLLEIFRNRLIFYFEELLAPLPTSVARGPPLVGCPQLLIQYIRSYPPYLEAVSFIRNLRTRHAVVTRNPHELKWFGSG
jgi:hypothetical protein